MYRMVGGADASSLAIEDVVVEPLARLSKHGHTEPHVCVVTEGAFEERGTRTVLAEPGTIRISPRDDEHDITFSSAGARCLVILLRDVDAALSLPSGRQFLRVDDGLRRAADVARAMTDAPLLAELYGLEFLVAVLHGANGRRGMRPAWLDRIRDALHASPAAPPSTTQLAAETGLHPVYVARVFRAWFGCSIADYARRLRAEHARGLICDTTTPLATVAALCGFADQAHLTRSLRSLTGLPPGVMRRRLLEFKTQGC